jgi:hypothetical protein
MARLLLIIGLVLIALWLLGFFAFHFTSPIIHGLVIVGVILVVFDMINNSRTRG